MTKTLLFKKLGGISFSILGILSVLAGFWPTTHPSGDPGEAADIAWLLTATALVLLMTPGLSYFYGGMVNKKNIISTLLQSFIALGVISVIWYVVGFSLAFGDSFGGFIGNPLTFLFFDNVGTSQHPTIGTGIPLILFAAFQLKFAIITPALITGSFAERVRFWAYLLFMILFTLFIYTPLAHWTWHPDGFLFKMGVLDFAGGTVVHISAGIAALMGAYILGPRKASENVGSNIHVPYVLLGTGLLWFGWFGFNAGSALSANEVAVMAFFNTNIASAAAMLTWILLDAYRGKKPSALGACIGAVVGLVAITPAAGFVNPGPSFFIGFIAAVISNFAVTKAEHVKLDDTLDVFACHGLGGIVGMILTAVFANEGGLLTTGETDLIVNHLIALVIVVVFVGVGSFLVYKLTDVIISLRVKEEHEKIGLDISQHDERIA
jgi:ammonium transporter, Amt family